MSGKLCWTRCLFLGSHKMNTRIATDTDAAAIADFVCALAKEHIASSQGTVGLKSCSAVWTSLRLRSASSTVGHTFVQSMVKISQASLSSSHRITYITCSSALICTERGSAKNCLRSRTNGAYQSRVRVSPPLIRRLMPSRFTIVLDLKTTGLSLKQKVSGINRWFE